MPTSLRQQPGKPTITDLPSLIRASALANPDSPAVLSEAGILTFGAFDQLSDRVAAYLENRGVGWGDRVGLYCINCSEFAVAYFGIVKAGATVVPINVLLTPTEIQFILKDAGVRAWIYHGNFEESASLVRPGIEDLNLEIIMGVANKNSVSWSEVIDFDKPPPRINFDPCTDLAAILYTSGTTGKPKGAMLSHANLSANIWSVRQAMGWRPGEEVILLVLPMFHAFAATVGMLACLAHGCAFVPVARFEPGLVLRTISRFSATIYLGVPSMYSLLLRIDPEMIGLFRSIRYCVSGGAALPIRVLEQFEARFGITVYEGDGPTECSPVTCVNPIGGETRPGTVGLPVPGVDMKIVDDEGNRVATGHVGEIAVRGQNVMRGYWNQDKETEAVMRNGWFLTGDLGTEDTDGYFSIVDRKKDLVIVNGMNVYPRIIEEVLYRMDGISEAAVIGQQHDLHGEIPVAYVVASDELDETVIRHWCREYLGRYQVPRKFYLVQSLPKNAAGKILKRELSRRGEYERGVDSDR